MDRAARDPHQAHRSSLDIRAEAPAAEVRIAPAFGVSRAGRVGGGRSATDRSLERPAVPIEHSNETAAAVDVEDFAVHIAVAQKEDDALGDVFAADLGAEGVEERGVDESVNDVQMPQRTSNTFANSPRT
jgi:hypothetical protein